MSIKFWREGDLIKTYIILTGKEGIDPENLFTLDKKQYSTRVHKLKLYTRRNRLELRRIFLASV